MLLNVGHWLVAFQEYKGSTSVISALKPWCSYIMRSCSQIYFYQQFIASLGYCAVSVNDFKFPSEKAPSVLLYD